MFWIPQSKKAEKSDSRKLDIWRGPSKGAVPSSLLCWRKHTINPTGRFLCLTVNCQRERNLEQFSVKEQKISAVQICLFLSIFGLFTRFLLPAEAGRNLWVALLQPAPQQGHPEQGAQDRVRCLWKISQTHLCVTKMCVPGVPRISYPMDMGLGTATGCLSQDMGSG